MSGSSELRDELLALKADVSRLSTTAGEELFNASKNHAEALADQIKADIIRVARCTPTASYL